MNIFKRTVGVWGRDRNCRMTSVPNATPAIASVVGPNVSGPQKLPRRH